MMSMLTLFHLGGRWLALDDKRLVPMDDYPVLDLPAVVITDFDGALTGVMSLEANSSMAAPLIERRLRDEGLVEGETRLEISWLVRVGKGFQALYSAVPMGGWQRIIRWANTGSDHRLVVPLLSVAKRLLQPGRAVVLRHGKQVTFLAINHDAIQYAETFAYSDDNEGIQDSVNALADRVRALLGHGRRPSSVVWYALDATPGQDESAYAAAFGAELDLEVQLAPHSLLTLPDGATIRSALPVVAEAVRLGDATSPRLAGVPVRAEQALPFAAVGAVVLSLALLLFGWYSRGQANEQAAQASHLQTQATQMASKTEMRLAALSGDAATLENTRQFVERVAAASTADDVSIALAKVRQSAQGWVRVLRLRVDETDHQLYVEGAIDKGVDGSERLGRFIANLRSVGFRPVAVDPPPGTQSADYFSYALHPVGDAVPGTSP